MAHLTLDSTITPVKRKTRPNHMLRDRLRNLREHPILENNHLMGRIIATSPPVTNAEVTAAVVGVGRDVSAMDTHGHMDAARVSGVHPCGQ